MAAALDLSAPAAEPIALPVPEDRDAAMEPEDIAPALTWWLGQMATGERLVEERLVWFWHDHFATSLAEVRFPYVLWQQHATIRANATGNFGNLLHAIARDPAMLFYLDGVSNTADGPNENFAREVMELHTLGRGNYSQEDVVEAARAFTGWVVAVPNSELSGRWSENVEPWQSYFVARRHDRGEKTLLGVTGRHDLDAAIDILLDADATRRFVASKLYAELVGLEADDATTAGLLQAVPTNGLAAASALQALRRIGYLPMVPPNPAGFAKGAALLGPHQLVHTLDFAAALADDMPGRAAADLFARFGCFDVSDESLAVVDGEPDARSRAALVLGSPEYAVV